MTRRRRLGSMSVLLGTVALVLGLTVSPAHAQAPEQTGWWFQALTGPLALPVPIPVVPDGGLFVQQGATTDPLAFGAVQYRVADGASSSLTLTAAPGSVALSASMQACKITSSWAATGGAGSWDARPSYGNPCAPGLVAADGSAVAFSLNASFVSNGTLDVAIVPLTSATPFAVAFEPPADDSLESAGGKQSTSPPLPTIAPTVPSAGGSPSGGSSGVAAGPARPVTAPAAAAPAASTGRSAVADNVLNVVGLGDPDRGARAAALGGASLLVVGWWLLSTQSVRVPRLLGGVGTAGAGAAAAAADEAPPDKTSRIGGVGRFARTRGGNALKLR
ncbi:MAG: hypothetical protein QOI95_3201 [Acidimicrobiaceae bacterium]|jgi:hypothetical protein